MKKYSENDSKSDFDEIDVFEKQGAKEKLDITEFELNDDINKKQQELFHFSLKTIVDYYNEHGKKKANKKEYIT